MIRRVVFIAALLVSFGRLSANDRVDEKIRVAFLSDVHIQNIFGEFSGRDAPICTHPGTSEPVTMRTMESQLKSTRLFNENYFAFIAALNDVAQRGVKYVVLPGDFSDDGQPVNVKAVKKILDEFSAKFGLEFFITTGNHDPVRPFSSEGGKTDFMGIGGRPQPVISKAGSYKPRSPDELPVVVTDDIRNLGYSEITSILTDYGFFPKTGFLYWETPFSTYNETTYEFKKAMIESSLDHRMYSIRPHSLKVPDVSYLVEPVDGLWLLAIDANVYIPKEEVSLNNDDPGNFNGTGVGYNQVLTHKQHILPWVRSVAERAAKSGKTLIAFSHYPMTEFYDGAESYMEKLFGQKVRGRIPAEEVAREFADAGIRIHFGGHMHINDTGIKKTSSGNTLLNVQVPSLAAYPPAYKLLTVSEDASVEIETITIGHVPDFNDLFGLYKIEYDYLKNSNSKDTWNKDILEAQDYYRFVNWHLRELVRLRLFPSEWPADLRKLLEEVSGKDLLILLHADGQIPEEINRESFREVIARHPIQWEEAVNQAKKTTDVHQLGFESFDEWNGFDLVVDFYRLGNGDQLARKEITAERFSQYRLLHHLVNNRNKKPADESDSSGEISLFGKLGLLFNIMDRFSRGEPSVRLLYNLRSGEVIDLEPGFGSPGSK